MNEQVTQCEDQQEMPRYLSHKTVWALKVKDIKMVRGDLYEMQPEEEGYGCVTLPAKIVDHYQPRPGWYYVVYKGGYRAFSPPKAFEEGYTRKDEIEPMPYNPDAKQTPEELHSWRSRMRQERGELGKKITKLSEMLYGSDRPNVVSEDQRYLMTAQLDTMQSYSYILHKRLAEG